MSDKFEDMLSELGIDNSEKVVHMHQPEDAKNLFPKDDELEIEESLVDLVCSKGYPFDFPRAYELQKLKNIHGDIYFISVGSLAELYLGSKFRNFIVRTIQKNDVVEYLSKGLELRDISSFDSFMVKNCCLYPILSDETISVMPFGVFESLINQIKLHSKLETQINVSKI